MLFSCSSISENSFNQFPITYQLEGKIVELENPHKISGVAVSDSFLFILDRSAPYSPAVAAYRLSSMQYVGSFAYTGKGPGEVLTPVAMTLDHDLTRLWLYDPNMRILGGYPVAPLSIEKNRVFQDQIILPFKDIEVVYNIKVYSKDKYALFMPSSEGGVFRLYENDTLSISTGKLGFDHFDVDLSKLPPLALKKIFSARSEYNFAKNKMAVFYSYTDRLQIINMNTNSVKTIQGPDFFNPKYTLVGDRIATNRETKTAYIQSASDDKYLYAIFFGNDFPDDTKGTMYLHVFDWDGNPICRYEMSPSCYFIALDAVNHKLYASSDETEHIVVYELKQHL